MTDNFVNAHAEKSISDIIRRKITYRVLLSLLVLFVFLVSVLIYNLNHYISSLESGVNQNYYAFRKFLLSQMIIDNKVAVDYRIKQINHSQDHYKITYVFDKKYEGDSRERKISFSFGLTWRIQYPEIHWGSKKFGYLVYEGSLLKSPIFLKFLLLLFAYLLMFILVSIIIYPVYKKVPRDLTISPIFYMLDIIRTKKKIKRDQRFNQLPTEIKDILFSVESLVKEVESSTKQVATYKFATRVAHDIRSPLAVLNSVVEEYKQTDDLDVETITAVCRRISKIANDIIMQNNPGNKQQSLVSPYLVAKEVINEKQYLAKKILCHLDFSFTEEVKTIFSEINGLELSRLLSNLLNNSMEAIREYGNVWVNLTSDAQKLILTIKDDGAGMPEKVRKDIISGRAISTKPKGSGIGLKSAIDYIQSLSGRLSIETVLGEGTSISIYLPTLNTPKWFINHLVLDPDDSILVVDDEPIIYNHWQEKLKKLSVNMHYISGNEKSVKAFDYIKESRYDLYLLDYQNPYLTKDGMEMISEYHLENNAILVTSNYDDPFLQGMCQKDNIKMIPKSFINELDVVLLNKAADIYLIEDDLLFAKSFCRQADLYDKSVQLFVDVFNAIRCAEKLNKSAKFYIDLNIESQRDGFYIANFLSGLGFEHLYILSGEDDMQAEDVSACVKQLYNKAKFIWSSLDE